MAKGRKFVLPPDREGIWTIYRTTNPFSSLDNRYTIQHCGEYFGDGKSSRFLGRKLLQPLHHRQHHTDVDYLMHHCRNPTVYSYNSEVAANYMDNSAFSGSSTSDDAGHSGGHAVSRRLFARQRAVPASGPARVLPTSTTEWCPDISRSLGSFKASNRVLALNQKPSMKPNSWKYSYHGSPKAYPTFNPLPGKQPSIHYIIPMSGLKPWCSFKAEKRDWQ